MWQQEHKVKGSGSGWDEVKSIRIRLQRGKNSVEMGQLKEIELSCNGKKQLKRKKLKNPEKNKLFFVFSGRHWLLEPELNAKKQKCLT